MSKYTTELRFICETLAGYNESQGYDKVDDIIDNALPKLFDFDFPMFDNAYRSVLEKKIVMHYYTREIGAETYGLWKMWLRTRLNEIMPYYNQLYATTVLDYNPLYDINYTRSYNVEKDGTEEGETIAFKRNTGSFETSEASHNTSEREVTDNGKNYFSDTPIIQITTPEDNSYLTNFTKTEDSNTDEYEGNGTVNKNGQNTGTQNDNVNVDNTLHSTEEYVETVVGSKGYVTYTKKVAEFRKNIINIDLMIIDELKDLFFGLW